MTRRKKTTREKQLARSAERRYAERKAQRKKRLAILVSVIGVILLAVMVVLAKPFAKDKQSAASPSPSSSTSAGPSASPASPAAGPVVTSQVKPASLPKGTACGGDAPPAAGKPKPQYSTAPDPSQVLQGHKSYSATIATSCGAFEVELDPEQAPKTVASFIFLANKGFFDGLTFHRIVDGFAIQGGDPMGTGTGGPGYEFATEIDPSLKFGKPGVLAMANSGPDTNGSQFFVTLAPDTQLNPSGSAAYTIFGQVTRGMDVVDKIGAVPTTDTGSGEKSTPKKPVYIEKVTIQAG